MRSYLELVDVPGLINSESSCEAKVSLFQQIITTGLDAISPFQSKTVHNTEPRWVSSSLKTLIRKRQTALHKGDLVEFRYLRNQVNRERKSCRAKYYRLKVEHLKECSSTNWWKEVKKLSGLSNPKTQDHSFRKSLNHLEGTSEMTDVECANFINAKFVSPMEHFEPLYPGTACLDLVNTSDEILLMTEVSTFKKLLALNPAKAQGPDAVSGWILKENADLLAGPVCDIINSSYQEKRLPSSWKDADIVPVPKQKPIIDVNKHLRPISLTSIISKIAEDHIVETYVKPAVLKKIDQHQYGTIPKSSSTHALISMMHKLYVSTDGNGATNRVVLFDFRKAFDLINHHILLEKLLTYDIPGQVVCWILDFLTFRRQRTKLATDCSFEWR